MQEEPCLYILYSSSLDRYYIGATRGISGRLRRHLSSNKGYTSKARDWKLVYIQHHSSIRDAFGAEKKLKQHKDKDRIRMIITQANQQHESHFDASSFPPISY